MTKLSWTGFSKKTPLKRREHLKDNALLSQENQVLLDNDIQLSLETANQMAENVLGRFSLPFAICPDVMVNGDTYHIPMVTEEPSVVAAASYASKLIKRSGGFSAEVHNRQVIGEVALFDVADKEAAQLKIKEASNHLIALAKASYPSIVKRGGGPHRLWTEIKDDFLIVYLAVDTQEAMGANMVNTMMEALVPDLEELSAGKSLMAILSNLAAESLVTATCRLSIRCLSRDKNEAEYLANKMALASQLAQIDPYRAATHNKGIFNGIDAAVLATGNDWRAIEAGGHAYASHDGHYRGLSTWIYDQTAKELVGQLTLPMPVASCGGSIGLNPSVAVARDFLNNPDAKTLATIIVSLGLAQNFAALKALTSTGIQAGHMKLQAKSLALLAGATPEETKQVVKELITSKHMNQETAQAILKQIRKN
ncbi:hydroxymethylglutaryl-CoA reductase, degradative [Streptococcus dentiloxodontae]